MQTINTMNMKNTYDPLTPEEVAALTSFAAYAGRYWKQELRDAWMNASMPGLLHKLRNSHGPSWLEQYRLPKPVEVAR